MPCHRCSVRALRVSVGLCDRAVALHEPAHRHGRQRRDGGCLTVGGRHPGRDRNARRGLQRTGHDQREQLHADGRDGRGRRCRDHLGGDRQQRGWLLQGDRLLDQLARRLRLDPCGRGLVRRAGATLAAAALPGRGSASRHEPRRRLGRHADARHQARRRRGQRRDAAGRLRRAGTGVPGARRRGHRRGGHRDVRHARRGEPPSAHHAHARRISRRADRPRRCLDRRLQLEDRRRCPGPHRRRVAGRRPAALGIAPARWQLRPGGRLGHRGNPHAGLDRRRRPGPDRDGARASDEPRAIRRFRSGAAASARPSASPRSSPQPGATTSGRRVGRSTAPATR